MVILVGGPSCTGKTMMAQRMLERYYMPYLSIDHLKMGLIRSGNSNFKVDDPDEKIAREIWPILKGMIMTCIENEQHLIVEGCYLLPELINTLEDKYLKSIRMFCLIFSKEYIQRHFESKIVPHRSVIEQRLYEESRPIPQVISEHENARAMCLTHGLTYFEIEEDYETEISKVFEYLDGIIGNTD